MTKKLRKLTTPGEEHLEVDEKGQVATIRFVQVEEDVDSWDAIAQALGEYAILHPNEMRLFLMENQQIRRENFYATGATKSRTQRRMGRVPVALLFKLERIMPDLFTNQRKRRTFFKEYPGFATIDKI